MSALPPFPQSVGQRTLKSAIHCAGIGLHTGRAVRMTLRPGDTDTGIVFMRTDVPEASGLVRARHSAVVDTRLCTVIGNEAGTTIGTIEHLMAAFRAADVDNAIVELDGPEVPIMDGSSAPFVFLVDCAGTADQGVPRRHLRILHPVQVDDGDKSARLIPADGAYFGFEIDFPSRAIGRQTFACTLTAGTFKQSIARARTFGFLNEVETLRKHGLALGGSLDNAIVVDGNRVVNPDGLRFADEFVRHKTLDAIGDLYLSGAPIVGRYVGVKAGHDLNSRLLAALFSTPSAWTWETADTAVTAPLAMLA